MILQIQHLKIKVKTSGAPQTRKFQGAKAQIVQEFWYWSKLYCGTLWWSPIIGDCSIRKLFFEIWKHFFTSASITFHIHMCTVLSFIYKQLVEKRKKSTPVKWNKKERWVVKRNSITDVASLLSFELSVNFLLNVRKKS